MSLLVSLALALVTVASVLAGVSLWAALALHSQIDDEEQP